MPLKVRLKPSEKIVINGAVVTAGDSGATLVLHNKAALLRAKDIMQESDANTPAKRIYFMIMLMYLDPESKQDYMDRYMEFMMDMMSAVQLPPIKKSLSLIHLDVANGDLYRALKTCRAVMKLESELLEYEQTDVETKETAS
ncbi:MAG: flagellar biosynthesis repressor FlbT [Alphaproteobacteria bacterium]|nr:flagellar biosynthesis repressor FlbT [Alphaproteobacteria bacterium SS10]